MPTPRKYRQWARECLELADQTGQLHAKLTLVELACDFNEAADEGERDRRAARSFDSAPL